MSACLVAGRAGSMGRAGSRGRSGSVGRIGSLGRAGSMGRAGSVGPPALYGAPFSYRPQHRAGLCSPCTRLQRKVLLPSQLAHISQLFG